MPYQRRCSVHRLQLYTACTSFHNIIIILIIIIIPRQCLWCCHHGRAIARVHPVHLMNVERRQAAADPRSSQATYVASPPVQAARIYTHHHHLSLLSPKADTHFTVPWRVERWVDLVGWSSSSRMRFMSHNWSATKQRLHPQSVPEISRHSVLSEDRIRQCETSLAGYIQRWFSHPQMVTHPDTNRM